MQDVTVDPLQLLRDLEQRCLAGARGLPMQEEARATWRGIGFVLGGQPLLASMERVGEILTVPSLTRVPLVKPWMLGIANVRGNLLPVMDFGAFIGLGETPRTDATRVIAVRVGEFSSGLLVDAVTGLQQIDADTHTGELPAVPDALREFLDGAFRVGDALWPVFDFARLAAHGGFIQAAA